MQQTNGYSEAWAKARIVIYLARGAIMSLGAASVLYFLLSQSNSLSQTSMAALLCLLCFTSSDALLQLLRFHDGVTRQMLRNELEFDGAQLYCRPTIGPPFPIHREQCHAYYPCREAIVLSDGRRLELRPAHPAARYWGTPYTYFTRTLFEAWWPNINLDALERKALSAFPRQGAVMTAITSVAIVIIVVTMFYLRGYSVLNLPRPDDIWVVFLLLGGIAPLWPVYVWDQTLRDRAVVQLPSSIIQETSTGQGESNP